MIVMTCHINAIFGFLSLSLADCLDILMVAALIFLVFRWIRGSAAMSVFIAVIMLFVLRVVVAALNMRLMNALLGTFIDVGVIALIVIFQPEVRHFLIRLGSRYGAAGKGRELLGRLFGIKEQLIVLPNKDSLAHIVETGDIVDAKVSRRLIMNIFFKNSPLHDGAMIIEGERIEAARCTLPITQRQDIPPSLGMRHKAAIGVSEETDAAVVVVSEETGDISYVHEGVLTHISNINELKLKLGTKEEKTQ